MQKSLFLLLFTSLTALTQNNTISDTTTDHATGEILTGTTIPDSRSGKGTKIENHLIINSTISCTKTLPYCCYSLPR